MTSAATISTDDERLKAQFEMKFMKLNLDDSRAIGLAWPDESPLDAVQGWVDYAEAARLARRDSRS